MPILPTIARDFIEMLEDRFGIVGRLVGNVILGLAALVLIVGLVTVLWLAVKAFRTDLAPPVNAVTNAAPSNATPPSNEVVSTPSAAATNTLSRDHPKHERLRPRPLARTQNVPPPSPQTCEVSGGVNNGTISQNCGR